MTLIQSGPIVSILSMMVNVAVYICRCISQLRALSIDNAIYLTIVIHLLGTIEWTENTKQYLSSTTSIKCCLKGEH